MEGLSEENADAWLDEERLEDVSTITLSPQIESADTVAFPAVEPNYRPDFDRWARAWKMTRVRNVGEAPLRIEDIRIREQEGSKFDISIPQPTDAEIAQGIEPDPSNDTTEWPELLAPNQEVELRVWFAPQTREPESGELIIVSNDPHQPEYLVALQGNFGAPCIVVSPVDALEFPQTSVAQQARQIVNIENCNALTTLTLTSVALTDDGDAAFEITDRGRFNDSPGEEMTLDGGEVAQFEVTFRPGEEREYEGALKIETGEDSLEDVELQLSGRGITDACPSAVATATILDDDTSVPGDVLDVPVMATVQLDASASSAPGDGALDYEWTLLSSPGSSSMRIEGAGEARATLVTDLIGEYKIALRVYNAQGAVNCGEPAVITLNVHPASDVHIQLTWRGLSPGVGGDMDLHYLHPNGYRWDSAAEGWDCYYRNSTPNWNVPSGSPALVAESNESPGPEAIRHSNLEEVFYKIGVHYYSDHGASHADATVEVFSGERLIYAAQDQRLTNRQFWLVGLLNGADHTVVPVDQITPGFP
ncbi:hypothetical protein [Bradymonas sediminis]|uniref:Abnormal spindle-like microcephaly-associated protein ASH domain-containing protein n=1 Tax=Bradymonas sediminis TaxID=1548548 RepID=A0A2Z4FMB8_9DELT|nr:hypothetical protein [Bradymonas sediminis]AWV89824.1 hypothetical protein DN745_10925 [Bradymonas sediminis]